MAKTSPKSGLTSKKGSPVPVLALEGISGPGVLVVYGIDGRTSSTKIEKQDPNKVRRIPLPGFKYGEKLQVQYLPDKEVPGN